MNKIDRSKTVEITEAVLLKILNVHSSAGNDTRYRICAVRNDPENDLTFSSSNINPGDDIDIRVKAKTGYFSVNGKRGDDAKGILHFLIAGTDNIIGIVASVPKNWTNNSEVQCNGVYAGGDI